jgi:hypothetical protein
MMAFPLSDFGSRWANSSQLCPHTNNSSQLRRLGPTDKAEYVWTVSNYRKYCGPVAQNIEEQAKAYAVELGAEDIWAGLDATLQHRRQVIGDRLTWCRLIGALWLNR